MDIKQVEKAKNIISDIDNIKYLIDYLKRDVYSNTNVSYEHRANIDKQILNCVGFENIVKYFNEQFDKYKKQIENTTINNMSNETKREIILCCIDYYRVFLHYDYFIKNNNEKLLHLFTNNYDFYYFVRYSTKEWVIDVLNDKTKQLEEQLIQTCSQ